MEMEQSFGYNVTMNGSKSVSNESNSESALIKLNDKMALRYLPVIIYIFLLMVTGIVGNTLVCFVYVSNKKKTSACYFILTLALLDLFNCVIGMPSEIVDLRYPYMFYSPVACKVLRTIEYISTVGSTVVLLAVAVDRYNRICNLGKHMSSEKSKKVCLGAVIIGVVTSWPVPILGGLSTVNINIDGANAVDCSIEQSMRKTIYPPLFNGLLCIYFIFCIVFFGIIYSRIIVFVKKRKAITRQMSSSLRREETKHDNCHEPKANLLNEHNQATHTNSERSDASNGSVSRKIKNKHRIKVTRTTVILGAVTLAFIIGYLPYLMIMAVRTLVTDFEDNLNAAADIGIKFCVKSYLINNAINPIIYCFLNQQFRNDVKKLNKNCS
ncbi:neuropeptide S receptor-like [Mytilus edulis]|uniref:neuropeptide S receptor-like n=1 Tax=Mytilus edulis TaxID=6550 RepID=UPI0039EE926B